MGLLAKTLKLNRAAFYGLAAKAANGIFWLAIAFAVSTNLSKSLQGYFFTFLSLATIQMLFDLGIGMTIIQFIAHEWSALPADFISARNTDAAARLGSVFRFAIIWYSSGAILLLALLPVAGFYFFGSSQLALWLAPWLLMCVSVALDFALTGFWTVIEGCNEVVSVYRYRAIKSVILGSVTLATLFFGGGLFSLGVGYLATIPLSLALLLGKNATIIIWMNNCSRHVGVRWRHEILPLHWRLAVSFASGYFAQWGMTPITFRLFGAATAGQFGMIWSIINAISAIAGVIVSVRAPQYGALIATKKYRELDQLAWKVSLTSMSVALLASVAVGAGIYFLNLVSSPLSQRVLPLGPSIIMLSAAVLWQIINPLAIYLRSHKREPYLWLSLGFAAGLIFLTVAGGRLFGPLGVTVSYFVLVAFFFLPGAILIFWNCRRTWHAPSGADISV